MAKKRNPYAAYSGGGLGGIAGSVIGGMAPESADGGAVMGGGITGALMGGASRSPGVGADSAVTDPKAGAVKDSLLEQIIKALAKGQNPNEQRYTKPSDMGGSFGTFAPSGSWGHDAKGNKGIYMAKSQMANVGNGGIRGLGFGGLAPGQNVSNMNAGDRRIGSVDYGKVGNIAGWLNQPGLPPAERQKRIDYLNQMGLMPTYNGRPISEMPGFGMTAAGGWR